MLIHHVERYIALRRATGFKLTDPARVLRSFAQWTLERGEDHVRAASVIAWAAKSRSQLERHRRLRVVARFAEFLRAEDASHEIPPLDHFPARYSRPTPYIFSEQDIAKVHVICAEGYLRLVRAPDALPHLRAIQFDPSLKHWAGRQLNAVSPNAN